jgi:hypothetical protein
MSSAVMEVASEHPASGSGVRTVFSGDRIFAVSAMKWTPASTMTPAGVFAPYWARARESPVKSATPWNRARASAR